MKKLLFAGVAAAAMFVGAAAAQAADYAAIAAGVNGIGWSMNGNATMESARAAAVRQCRSLGGSCSVSTAEESWWYFSAGYCNGVPYTAASRHGPAAAEELVFRKGAADGNYDCHIERTF